MSVIRHEQNARKQRRRATAALVLALLLAAGGRPARSEEQAVLPAKLVPAKPPPATAALTTCRRSAFRVVVDVGHTLDVPGAISARGIPEYDFNLRLGGEVRQALLAAGFDKTVLLITAEPPPLGLFVRATRANAFPADLLLSIHHDSVPDNLLETWHYAGQENHFSDRFKGYSLFISNDNADRAGSLQFARLLGDALQARGLQYTPHYTLALMGARRRELIDSAAGIYRYDQLIVLRETRMPAVLLEAGSIVNRAEELELASPQRRSLVAAAVAAAVEDFCAARPRGKGSPSAKRSSNVMVQPTRADAAR